MKYPSLVPKRLCKTPIKVEIEQEGLTEDGGPIPAFVASLHCNYQDIAKTIQTDDGKQIQLTGKALFCGDIAPDLPVISGGKALIFGVQRDIIQGIKARNPDGTVNYTELRLK